MKYNEEYKLIKTKLKDKPFCVYHFTPQQNGTWLLIYSVKYFSDEEAAHNYYNTMKARLKK